MASNSFANRIPDDPVVSPFEGMVVTISSILNNEGGTFVGFAYQAKPTDRKKPLRGLINGTVLKMDFSNGIQLEDWPLLGYAQGEYYASYEKDSAGYIEVVFPNGSDGEIDLSKDMLGMKLTIVQLPQHPKAVSRFNLRMRLANAQMKKAKKP